MQQILTYFFLVVYSVTILGIILVVITDNRNPLKTLPWIIVLVLAPVLGLIFYFFFGQNLSKQRIISRRTRKRITLQLEEAEHTDGPDLPEAYRPLAALLTKALVQPVLNMTEDLDHIQENVPYRELIPFAESIHSDRILRENNEKMRQGFTANVSHELKTPLTVILTNTELLQSPDYDEAQKQQFTDGIRTMAQQMRALVERLLELARAENARPQAASFFTLRAVAEKLLRRFGIDIYALRTETLQNDLFGEALSMSLGGKELLQIGTVSSKIRRRLDVKQDVYYLEMNFDALVKSTRKHKIAAEELSKFPEVKRDLALLIDKQVTFSALRDVAFATERKLLKSVSLFDVYEGDKLPEGKKSYALSFILEDKTRTLDEKAIERAMQNLTAQFERQCGAHVRA